LITLSARDEQFDQTSFEPFSYTDYLYDCYNFSHPMTLWAIRLAISLSGLQRHNDCYPSA